MGHFYTLVRPRSVTGDGEGLVSHAGLVWLGETADLSGLTAGLSNAMARLPQRRHDPGRTLAQMILALCDGATCLSDLEAIRAQYSMFGVTLLADALAQLPMQWAAGHNAGDGRGETTHPILIRSDAGAGSHWFAEECVDRNLEFSFGFHIDQRVRDGVMCAPERGGRPAVDGNGKRRDGAEIIELTSYVDLNNWPENTRLIVRRERPHPGAQLSLFDTIEGARHTAFITNQTSTDIAALELQQRQRARSENVIRYTKACGLANLPFYCVVNNEAWMNLSFAANDLLAWAQHITSSRQFPPRSPCRPP